MDRFSSEEITRRAKRFLQEYIVSAMWVLFIVCGTSYLVLVYKLTNVLTIVAVIFSFCWLISILFNIYKIVMDMYQKNICSKFDQVLVMLEEYYDDTFLKKKKYFVIHFDNYNYGKTSFKYNGNTLSAKEDDYVEFTYLGRSKIIINIHKINKKQC